MFLKIRWAKAACTFPYTRIGIFWAFLAMLYDGTRWSGILTFCGFVLFLSQSLRVSESRESRESQSLGSLRVSGMLYSTSLNPMFFKNIANVGSFHFHFHFRIWRIWKIWKSGKSEIKENWKVIWQKPRESRSLGSLGVSGVSESWESRESRESRSLKL